MRAGDAADWLQRWAGDDDGGGLMFQQQDIDKLVQTTEHSDPFGFNPLV
jgi:hypothetical protein